MEPAEIVSEYQRQMKVRDDLVAVMRTVTSQVEQLELEIAAAIAQRDVPAFEQLSTRQKSLAVVVALMSARIDVATAEVNRLAQAFINAKGTKS